MTERGASSSRAQDRVSWLAISTRAVHRRSSGLRIWRSHRVDDWVLCVQSLVDRVACWARREPSATAGIRRFLVVQIDGLSAEILDRALTSGRIPHLARLLRSDRMRRAPMRWDCPRRLPHFKQRPCTGSTPISQDSTTTTSARGSICTSRSPASPISWSARCRTGGAGFSRVAPATAVSSRGAPTRASPRSPGS